MAACLSGAVASALTYDQISAGDQVGLLLGKVVIDVKDTVSDSQISTTKVDTSVHIFSHVPCPHSLWFYDKTGKVVDSNLKALIKERQKDIVGWYRFRRHSSLRVSLRETAVHRSLLQTLGVPQTEHFVFLLTTASATTNLSTHSYDHVIYNLTSSNEFTSMSLSVINLGDTTHSQYKHHSAIVTPTGAGRYHTVVKKFENQFHDDTGGIREVSLVQELAANLISQLEKISLLVLDEEKQLEELEKEVEKYEQVAKQLNNRPKSGLSPLSQNSSQNSGVQDEEDNTNKQVNRESVPTDKERLITDFLNNSESEHKIQLEVHLTKSQQGNNSSGLFGGDTFMSSSSSSSSSLQPTQNTGESLLHKLPNEPDANLSAPLKPSTISAGNNNSTSSRKSVVVVRGEAPHMSAVTATTIKNVGEVGLKRPASASDHFSFVENVLKEAKELPEVNGEDSLRLDNCVTVPMGAQLQSPPGVANMCSQVSKNNPVSLKNDSLPESTNSNTNAVPATTSSTGTRRKARSRSEQQQQQQSGSMTVGKATPVTRSYSPLSARNASPSPTPTTVAGSGTDGGGSGSPRHIRTRTPQSRGTAASTTASSRESRIDSNRSSASVTTSKADSLNKEVQKSPVRRCRRTRPNERTLSLSNSPSRREVNSIDYSSVRCERPVSPFF